MKRSLDLEVMQSWFKKCEERGLKIILMGTSVHAWKHARTDLPWDLSVAWLDDAESLDSFYELMASAKDVHPGLEKWIDWSLMVRLVSIPWWEDALVPVPTTPGGKKHFNHILAPDPSLWLAISFEEFSELEYSLCLDVISESLAKKLPLRNQSLKEKIAEISLKAHPAKLQRLDSLSRFLTD